MPIKLKINSYNQNGYCCFAKETLFKTKVYMARKEQAVRKVRFRILICEAGGYDTSNQKKYPKGSCHRADDIFTAIRIAKEFDIDITLDHCTEGHLIADDLAKGKGAIVGPLGHRTKFELQNKSWDTPRILAEAGVKIAITTDSPVIPLHNLALCADWLIKQGWIIWRL